MINNSVELGDKVEVLKKTGYLVSQRSLYSRIQDIPSNQELIITTPIENGKIVPLEFEEGYYLCIYTAKGLYRCEAEVIDRKKEDNLYVATLRVTSKMQKYQRRQYYRLDCVLTFQYKNEENKELWSSGIILDISGGGLRFTSNTQILNGEAIVCHIQLTLEEGQKHLYINGTIIECNIIDFSTNTYETRISFDDITNEAREAIIRFIFEEERKRRKKKKECDDYDEKEKILIVDDSAFMRRVISDIINGDNRCEVIGTASNGKEGLELAKSLNPDVITLDVQMPVMNGLEMLKILNKEQPTPVIMLSTLMKEGGRETIEALELGAYDFVKKPDNIFKVNSDDIKAELIEKVLEASKSGKNALSQYKPSISLNQTTKKASLPTTTSKVRNLIALGTSTGGPRALQYVLPYLPSNMNAGMVIVQHMPPGFTKSLSDRLNQLSEIFVKEAEDNDVIENGKAFIAPGDKHLEVIEDRNGNLIIRLTDDPPRGGHKPAVNTMMTSVSAISSRKLIGVIMTGMGADGMEGMMEVKSKQKMHIIAQNEETCVVYGMPKSVVDKGIADEVVPLEKIAEAIIKQSGGALNMDISQYLEIFIEESKEHLQGLNTSLLELEKGTVSKDVINEVFRAAHTLKGMAATMGFKGMNVLTHDMENVLSEIRNDNIKVNANLLDILFQCLDALERFVDNIIETGNEGTANHDVLINKLNAVLEGDNAAVTPTNAAQEETSAKVEKVAVVEGEKGDKYSELTLADFEKHALSEAKKEKYNCYGLTIYISENCVLKSARAFIIFRTLENLGQIIKSSPTVQDIEDEKFDSDFSLIIVSKDSQEEVHKQLMSIAEVDSVKIGEVQVEEYAETTSSTSEESEDSSDTPARDSEQGGTKSKPKTNRTVRVDIERLDTLMNLVSELIIIKNGLETVENTNQNFTDQIEYLERITTNLHDAVMKVRMVPIERVFNRFPRLIRDLSRQLQKNMEFHMSGEETELDRTVIDEIGDPLVHLIRNSADHGIEMPNVRIQNGKEPMGHVYLKAYQDGNNVVIEVADDGAGINVARVKAKAIEKGTISSEQSEMMTDQEIIELLFRPSFSTAEVISDVSGRGVGLDVVKTKIEALGGIIEVKNELGKGSKFIIRLPLTLAIIQALMVNIADEKYAIPLNTIQNIENVNISDIKYIQNQEVINLRGQVIPVLRLYDILEVQNEQPNKEFITVVIVNKGDKKAGFVVDSLIGQQEIVIKTLGKFLTNIKMIAGATILGNGDVALILDVNTLV